MAHRGDRQGVSERAAENTVSSTMPEHRARPLADVHRRIVDARGRRLRIGATVHLWSHPLSVGKVISFPDLEERGDGVEVLWRGERSSETFPACFPDARRARAGDETLQCEDLVLAEAGS